MATLDRTTVQFQDASATRIRRIGRYTGPAAYTTGGDPLTPAELALGKVDLLIFEHPTDGTTIRLVEYEVAARTVKWYDLAGTEIANGTNLSTFSARFEAIGK